MEDFKKECFLLHNKSIRRDSDFFSKLKGLDISVKTLDKYAKEYYDEFADPIAKERYDYVHNNIIYKESSRILEESKLRQTFNAGMEVLLDEQRVQEYAKSMNLSYPAVKQRICIYVRFFATEDERAKYKELVENNKLISRQKRDYQNTYADSITSIVLSFDSPEEAVNYLIEENEISTKFTNAVSNKLCKMNDQEQIKKLNDIKELYLKTIHNNMLDKRETQKK